MNWFHVRELRCKDGTPYPKKWRDTRLQKLLRVANAIRERWGRPLKVVSGYRTEEYNKAVGGVKNSQHPKGRAMDIIPIGDFPMDPDPVEWLHRVILTMARDGELPELGGLGFYENFIHIDVRPKKRDRLARWRGKGR